MNRRDFAIKLPLVSAAAWAALPALAQGDAVEGRDFVRLSQPVPMPAGAKIDVVEFFGYWCPHCNAFEPALDAWQKKLPPAVAFRRMPVAFSGAHEPYQRLYFALEAMGLIEALHRKVFAAVHLQKMRFDKESDVLAFVTANGVDGAKFTSNYKSFSMDGKIRQARQLAEAYKIDSVPTLGVHGRYFTSPSLAGGADRSLAVADMLIARSIKG